MPDVSYIRTRVIKNELCIIPTELGIEPAIYPPFSHATKRDGPNRVNPFFLCMNATVKYEHHCRKYGMGTMSPRVNALFQKAVLIVALVYAVFEPAPGSYGAKKKAERGEDRKRKRQEEEEKEDGRKRGRQTRSRQAGPTVEGSGSEAIADGELKTLGSGESEGAMVDQRSDFGSDTDESSRTPDADEDIAFFDAITEELKNPGLSMHERVRLAMLQLFGGKDYETPHIPGVPDPPSVFDRISRGDYDAYEPPEE